MSSLPWATHFGVSESDISNLQSRDDAHGSNPLRTALLTGKIAQADYLRWAMERYEIPSLKNSFFDIPHDLIFWEAVSKKYDWNPSFYPLAEWQGVLYIGCLELPTFHFNFRDEHRFVLVAAAPLVKRFQEFEPHFQAQASDMPQASDVPQVSGAPAVASAPVLVATVTPSPATVEVRQRPLDEFLADSLPEAPDVSLEDPDGLLVKIPPASTPNLFVVADGLDVDDIGAPISTAPDGLENIGTSVLDFSSIGAEEVAVATPPPSPALNLVATAPVLPPAPPEIPKAPPASLVPPVSLAQRPYVEPAAAAEGAPAKPTPPPPIVLGFGQAKLSAVSQAQPAAALETCASLDMLGAAAIGHVLKNFEQGMVLLYQNGELRAWKWTEQLLSVRGDKPDAIPLATPSIFRIAQSTCLPYHGYVVANPTNTVFFNNFNRGKIPQHVTLVPFMTAGKIAGMLMGLSDQKVDYKASLSAMEKLASEFGTQLERLRARNAA